MSSRNRFRSPAFRGRRACRCAFRLPIEPVHDLRLAPRLSRQLPAEEDEQVGGLPGVERPLPEGSGVGLTERPAAEPGVDGLAAVAVVVVLGLELDGRDGVLRTEERVDALHRRELDAGRVPGPVAGRRHHEHRPRGREGGDLHVARVEAQVRRVLADVPALHRVRDHVDGGGEPDPVVHGAQQERLRPSPGGSGRGEAAPVDVGERLQEVDRADAVPQVEAQRSDAPQREARVEEAVVHLARVVVADHVVREDDVALPGEGDAARRDRARVAVLQPPVGPVAVRGEHPGEGPGLPHRAVQVPRDVEARVALEVDLLDGVVAPLDPAEDLRVERGLLRHRPQARAHQDLLAEGARPREPGVPVGVRREGVRCVEGPDLHGAPVHGGDGLEAGDGRRTDGRGHSADGGHDRVLDRLRERARAGRSRSCCRPPRSRLPGARGATGCST